MGKIISGILTLGTLTSTILLILSVLLQIFARFFLEKAPPWTEEASRLFFIYAIAFASGLAMKSNEYVQLDLIYKRLSGKWKRRLDTLIPVMILVLFGLAAIFSVSFILLGVPENSPSMNMSMSVAFTSMLIMSLAICFYAFQQLILNLRKP